MTDSQSLPQIGQVVRILRGRDAGQYAIVIKILDERFVLIADGNKRKFDSPKKKNIKHLQLCRHVATVVKESIQETGRVTNGKLRFALNKFKETLNDEEKGE
ncbi:50S ribosomal protein L14 [Caldalkalibacillus thermarum]|uniref:KOW domain-containing RNA-binding protein n=1 Tax=Caldalkalibacillus thermarum TaxID=296745 RepID=UPI0016652055|nr:KOW domain-containing RNA-binding protein [Caldalkalibacillus thermarum]GGK21109.1 50S ribosomal protein L14 [Caldalkalibacillus thermarum]